jgi:hypothetical protein
MLSAISDGMLLAWAAVAGALSMILYARLTPQDRIRRLKRVSARVQERLRSYEGDFQGAMALSRRNVGLALSRLWLSAGPSLVAGIPVIAVMLWAVPTQLKQESAMVVFFVVAAGSALLAKFALKAA